MKQQLSTTQVIMLELLYWIARLLSTYAVWLLTSHLYIKTAFAIRGYADVGGEWFLCWFASVIWFMGFKVLVKGEDEDKHEEKHKRNVG